jgi:hypothetical protein
MLRLTSRVAIAAMTIGCAMIAAAGSSHCESIVTGGLDAPEVAYTLGPNLLVNGDLRSGLQGWTLDPSCFSLEGSGDNASLKLQEPCGQASPFAQNDFKCPAGLYTISAEIKTNTTITVPKGRGGTRVRLLDIEAKKWAMSKPAVGTTDWSPLVKAHAEVADGNTGFFRAETVGPVAGTSWFRKLFLGRELPTPLETFLLYPNYRGMMFSDQSQVASVAIDVRPPADTTMAQLHVVLEMMDAGGKVLSTHQVSLPANGSTVATIDMSSLPAGQYRLQGYLQGPGDKRIFTQSSYTIAKVSSETRASMKAWIDADNNIHMGGRARFVIGLYDTTGFAFRSNYYTPRLTAIAKAPINLMINYFLSNGRADVIYPYTEAMEPFGIFYLAAVNAFFPEMRAYPRWAQTGNVPADQVITQYAKGLAGDSRVVGYYTCDECASERQPRTLHQYSLIKQYDPASITFAVENFPKEFQYWRDTVDVLGIDPYVIGSSSAESAVGDSTRTVIGAVHGARPVWTVIQFFWLSSLSHFPTEQELHDMSWMAITEGARGVFYWSYGLRGLDWGRRDPVLRQQRYDELVAVTKGISALEPALIAADDPILSANSAAGTVITKEKDLKDGSRYLISYNHSGDSVDARFTLRRPARTISVVAGENRSIAPSQGGSQFNDTYAPFQAHVYKID